MTFQPNNPYPPVKCPVPDIADTCVLYPEERMFLTQLEEQWVSAEYEYLLIKAKYGNPHDGNY